MAKEDFCFTYYDGDALRDMSHMNRLERGAYNDLVLQQRKFGRMTLEQIRKILGKDFEECWPSVNLVLIFEGDKYYIEWLETSILKMRAHSKKQSENKKGKTKQQPELNQTTSKQEPNSNQTKPLENGDVNGSEDGFEIEFKEGAQKEISHTVTVEVPREAISAEQMTDEWFTGIFDDGYMEGLVFPYRDVPDIRGELERFKVKVRGDPGEYGKRDTGGIRNAFLHQLNKIKPGKPVKTISEDRMKQFRNL